MTDEPGTGTIRAARPDDHASVLEVARASGLFGPDEMREIEVTPDRFLSGAGGDDRWVVDQTGADGAGGIAYYAPERMTDGTWNVHLLAVHPDRQGRGRGAALMRHVEQDLGSRGARVLLVETSGARGRGASQLEIVIAPGGRDVGHLHAFYDSRGFADDGRRLRSRRLSDPGAGRA